MSKFDISTQLTLRKKQQLIKERNTLNRLHQNVPSQTDVGAADEAKEGLTSNDNNQESDEGDEKPSSQEDNNASSTEFTPEFSSFLKLKKWDNVGHAPGRQREVVYAELTGEWSRPRVYICSTCTSKHVSILTFLSLKVKVKLMNLIIN